jgi:hypothetical protein
MKVRLGHASREIGVFQMRKTMFRNQWHLSCFLTILLLAYQIICRAVRAPYRDSSFYLVFPKHVQNDRARPGYLNFEHAIFDPELLPNCDVIHHHRLAVV